MTTALTLRSAKGAELTHAEVDGNFTALRETADRADWSFDQTRWSCTDFVAGPTTTGVFPFGWTAISSGTMAAVSGAAHPLFGAIAIRDSTTAGGGGMLENGVALFATEGFAIREVFRIPGVATATARLGCSNSLGTALGNNFAFMEVVGTTATFRARRLIASEPEVVDSSFELTAGTDYVLDIDWLSSTDIRFVCWELATGTVLRSWTATTEAWPNPAVSGIRVGARASESTTGAAADILVIDYIGFGPARPGSLKVPV